MAQHRRGGSRNMLRGVLAFFWIALAGVSGVYLYSALADPAALGGQLANPLPVGSSETTSAFNGSGSRDRELAEIKASLRELTQQMAAISTKLNLEPRCVGLDRRLRGCGLCFRAGEPLPDTRGDRSLKSPPRRRRRRLRPLLLSRKPSPSRHRPKHRSLNRKQSPSSRPRSNRSRRRPRRRITPAPKPYEPPPVAVSPIDDLPAEEGPTRAAMCRHPRLRLQPQSQRRRQRLPRAHLHRQRPRRLPRLHPHRRRQRPRRSKARRLDPVALPPAANDGSTRYGIEIGSVAKQDGLRPLWREFLTNHAALVAGLQPRRVLAPDKKWRLIAGPFSSADGGVAGLRSVQEGVAALRGHGLRRRRAVITLRGTAGPSRGRRGVPCRGPL